MTSPTSQKADARPISFVLHDTSVNAAPIVFPLVIRPEDLTRNDQSRLSVHQTLGGAWADNFGPGLPTVTLAGHTGWGGGVRRDGSGGRPDGFDQFVQLHTTIYKTWHALRDSASRTGRDPNQVRLLFVDGLDDFTWLVAPQSFVLKRNKSRPLLSQYQITLVKLADDIYDPPPAAAFPGTAEALGLSSLSGSLDKIQSFAKSISGAISAALGPIAGALKTFVTKTAGLLSNVKTLIQAGKDFLSYTTGPLLDVARLASQAAHNVMCLVSDIKSIPGIVKAKFMQVTGAFRNVFCVLKNIFKARSFFPDYSSAYGASTCSSTAGGSPPSAYAGDTVSLWKDLYNKPSPGVSMSPDSFAAHTQLVHADVMAPPSQAQLGALLTKASNGLQVAGVA